jgi:hypothetical protein
MLWESGRTKRFPTKVSRSALWKDLHMVLDTNRSPRPAGKVTSPSPGLKGWFCETSKFVFHAKPVEKLKNPREKHLLKDGVCVYIYMYGPYVLWKNRTQLFTRPSICIRNHGSPQDWFYGHMDIYCVHDHVHVYAPMCIRMYIYVYIYICNAYLYVYVMLLSIYGTCMYICIYTCVDV